MGADSEYQSSMGDTGRRWHCVLLKAEIRFNSRFIAIMLNFHAGKICESKFHGSMSSPEHLNGQ